MVEELNTKMIKSKDIFIKKKKEKRKIQKLIFRKNYLLNLERKKGEAFFFAIKK